MEIGQIQLFLGRMNVPLAAAQRHGGYAAGREPICIQPAIGDGQFRLMAFGAHGRGGRHDAWFARRQAKRLVIELAIDVMEMSACVDHVVIFSGDGDFRRMVEAVQRRGRRVSVVSTIRTAPPMVADELRRQADNFIELDDLRSQIAREGGKSAAPQFVQTTA